MKEEARLLLASGLDRTPRVVGNVADAIATIMDPLGGVELDLPMRSSVRINPWCD
jgi:hypothetical protein